MHIQNPNQDDPTSRHSVEQIWRIGCDAGPLSNHDWKHFVSLARNRFYTFHLGVDHAIKTGQRDQVDALQAGFITELLQAPGLEALWQQTEFRTSEIGKETHKLMRRRKFRQRFRFV